MLPASAILGPTIEVKRSTILKSAESTCQNKHISDISIPSTNNKLLKLLKIAVPLRDRQDKSEEKVAEGLNWTGRMKPVKAQII